MKTTSTLWILLGTALALGGACAKDDKQSAAKATTTEKAPEDELEATKKVEPAELPDLTQSGGSGSAAGTGSGTGTGTGTGTGSGAAKKVDAPKAPKLDLIAEGAEPRFLLTYQAPIGTQQTMVMSLDITAEVPVAGKVVMPTMLMTAAVVVDSVDEKGNITSKMTFSDMEVRDSKASTPGLAEVLKDQITKIKGTGMTMQIAPSGQVISFKVDAATDPALQQTVGQTQQTLDQMVAQLPEKPVGKGAKWKIKQTVDQQGMKVDQTITYELLEVTATTAKIKGSAVMKAPKQDVEQQGVKVSVEKLDGTARTTMDVDFTKVVPKLTGDVKMKMTMKMAGQVADVAMTTKMKIEPQ